MDIVTYAKNIGAVLATATTLAYVSGYVALRTRAHILGTDPGFTLLDEGYVFAGFRFLFVTLITLLLLAPIVLILRSVLEFANGYIPAGLGNLVQWVILTLVAGVTLFSFKILSVNGVLLQPRAAMSHSVLQEAIIEGGSTMGIILTFSLVLLATLSALWLKSRLSIGHDSFVWVLGIVVAIQQLMLPIYHGALFADRKVQVLAATPSSVQRISRPLGIVDRTSEHATLLGIDGQGQKQLATIKLEDLNGIPINKIVKLKDFLEKDLAANQEQRVKETPILSDKKHSPGSTPISGDEIMSSNDTGAAKNVLQTFLDYLQMTFEAIGSLGDSVVESGQLWSVELDSTGKPFKARRIGKQNNLAWPVGRPEGKIIYALQKNQIVRFNAEDQSTEFVDTDPHWVKLLGVNQDGAILGMIYQNDENRSAILTKNGDLQVSQPPTSDEEKTQRSRFLQENRSYVGNRTLFVERSERGGRGFDVFLKTEDQIVNISDCGDDSCGQPSVSPDFRRVFYIRQPRY